MRFYRIYIYYLKGLNPKITSPVLYVVVQEERPTRRRKEIKPIDLHNKCNCVDSDSLIRYPPILCR